MTLKTIYVVRHGFRSAWSVDQYGNYRASIPSPTGIAADPALTSHGIKQARELATHLAQIEPPVDVVYSSPYYRCLQTIAPFVEQQQSLHSQGRLHAGAGVDTTKIRPEFGMCEWFGAAPFEHPQPADAQTLKDLIPAYDETYIPKVRPPPTGETYSQLQRRVSAGIAAIIDQCNAEGKTSVVVCTHAAVVIVLGRVLTGKIPADMDIDDFQAFTCGVSVYTRDKTSSSGLPSNSKDTGLGDWTCEKNSDCSFLSQGAERGW
ncbi:hypothetical protein VHEMI05157 [[Torrubiella] hemipterigena]|uniref:Phosphoglycerate mutase family protein n=2 Tax=[Torrubiella] hemipterigena TaxID=1531966 RepID=A0A0A1TGD1_9HYPO|nr:hypothetical protein VHEMI05157 [[Torrubiella] hemipterigena]